MQSINASIEASAKHVAEGKLEAGMLPLGTRVYLTDVGVDPVEEMVKAARTVNDMGYVAVPHIPARRIESEAALESRLKSMAEESGVNDVLVIAGEGDQLGPFDESMMVLQTGLLDQVGITSLGIAGHPEGNDSYQGRDATEVLKGKIEFLQSNSDADVRIVTQFGFDGPLFVDWARQLAADGVTNSIHLGVAGPAKITTLVKYAAMCGVGNSLRFFKKRTSAIAQLATKHSPEDVVMPIEEASRLDDNHIAQLHVFPFGGIKSSAEWLVERGSFTVI